MCSTHTFQLWFSCLTVEVKRHCPSQDTLVVKDKLKISGAPKNIDNMGLFSYKDSKFPLSHSFSFKSNVSFFFFLFPLLSCSSIWKGPFSFSQDMKPGYQSCPSIILLICEYHIEYTIPPVSATINKGMTSYKRIQVWYKVCSWERVPRQREL